MTFAVAGSTDKIASCYDDVMYPLKEELRCTCASFTPYPVGPWSQVRALAGYSVITLYGCERIRHRDQRLT